MNRKQVTAQSGFTLVEIMVVVVILSLLATVSFVGYQKFFAESQNDIAATKCSELEGAMNMKALSMGGGLDPEEMIERLLEDRIIKEMPKDPWGEDILVLYDEEYDEYVAFSKGKNRTEGDDDDVFSHGLRKDIGK